MCSFITGSWPGAATRRLEPASSSSMHGPQGSSRCHPHMPGRQGLCQGRQPLCRSPNPSPALLLEAAGPGKCHLMNSLSLLPPWTWEQGAKCVSHHAGAGLSPTLPLPYGFAITLKGLPGKKGLGQLPARAHDDSSSAVRLSPATKWLLAPSPAHTELCHSSQLIATHPGDFCRPHTGR